MIVISNPERDTLFPLLKICAKNEIPLISIDLETNGLDRQKNHILQIGAVEYAVKKENEIFSFEEKRVFNRYAKPPVAIPADITAINGISDETVKNAPRIEEVLLKFHAWCGERFVAAFYNAPFDVGFLQMSYIKYGTPFTPAGVIDVYRVAKETLGFARERHDLVSLVESFKIQVDEGHAHDAVHDARCTVAVMKELLPGFSDIIEKAPKGTEAPIILDVKKDNVFFEVYCKYYGKIILDPYVGTWSNEWGCFDKLSVNKLEKAFLEREGAESLRALAG